MKLKYLDKNGYAFDKDFARKSGLIEGVEYEVDSIEIHSSSTDVYLVGYRGSFNSVMFDEGDEDYKEYHSDVLRNFYEDYFGRNNE